MARTIVFRLIWVSGGTVYAGGDVGVCEFVAVLDACVDDAVDVGVLLAGFTASLNF